MHTIQQRMGYSLSHFFSCGNDVNQAGGMLAKVRLSS